ncbi:MAG: T9SS type A sorting domain-containing protein [Saprospiraceae bacterium]|nr:T9SS type A sorting domain-containing protein [Saprospiraceae bacterium]
MKKLLQIFILIVASVSLQCSFAAPVAPAGYTVRTVATGGLLAGQTLFGVIVDPVTANVFVAGVSGFTGNNFNLYKITPAGVVTFIANYPFGYFQAVKMAWGPDGKIYTHNSNTNTVYSIDPTTGTSSLFSSGIVLGSPRHSLNFDAAGRLIIGYESMFDFIWVTAGGPVYLGNVTAPVPNGNHGDGFGILPNGDYVVYTDCGGQNNYAISTAGHVNGTPYPSLSWTGTTNIFSIMTGCQYSLGTVDPLNGDVYTTINNGGSGNDKIILTGGSGGASTVFISGGSGITDIYSGKASSGSGISLYFVDRITNTVYEVTDCPPSIGVCAASPTVYDGLGRTSVFSSINLAGTGTNKAVVQPGAAVSLSLTRNTTVNGGCGGCCGCITQHYLGMNDGTSTVFSSCLFSTTGGSAGSHTINFTAPSTPGVYYINPTATWWFSCNQFGIPTYTRAANNAIAVLVVGCGQTDCQDITVTAAANVCTAVVNYPSYCAYDDAPGATISQTGGLASGVSYPVGLTTNTFKATDASGKMTTCSFNVNVLPFSCKYPIQVYHRDTTTNSAKIKWKAQSGTCATNGKYELRNRWEISPGVWSAWTAWVPKNTAILEHNFTGLGAGRFYHYQIHTICGTTTSTDINGWFHTLPGGALRKEITDIATENGRYDVAQQQVNGFDILPLSIHLAPNPAYDFTELYIQGFEKSNKEVAMYDLNGRLVFRVRVTADQNNLGLDLKTLKVHNGVYLIRVSDGKNQKTEQLIIER